MCFVCPCFHRHWLSDLRKQTGVNKIFYLQTHNVFLLRVLCLCGNEGKMFVILLVLNNPQLTNGEEIRTELILHIILKCVIDILQVSEYLVVCFTSSLTFSIAGVAKEIMTLSLAVYIYNEHLSYINLVSSVHHSKTLRHLLPYQFCLCLVVPFSVSHALVCTLICYWFVYKSQP